MISNGVCRKQVESEVRNYTEFSKLEETLNLKLKNSLEKTLGEPMKFCYEVAKNFILVKL